MESFSQLTYARPDFDKRKEELKQYAADLQAAKSYEELRDIFLRQEQSSRQFQTMFEIAYVRNTIDTRDPFYEEEMSSFYQQQGLLAVLAQEAAAALLASPFLTEFQQEFGELTVKNLEVSQKLASPAVVDDMIRESELCQEYNRTTAGCSTNFRGEECNFYGLLKHMQSTDREERREGLSGLVRAL